MKTQINGTVAFLDCGGPDRQISVNGEIHHFEMHPYCGPMLTDKEGEPLSDQTPEHFFWTAVSHWAQQGQRIENGLCVWDHPSENITKHMGGKHYMVVGRTDPIRGN